jgi:hypothetical protein
MQDHALLYNNSTILYITVPLEHVAMSTVQVGNEVPLSRMAPPFDHMLIGRCHFERGPDLINAFNLRGSAGQSLTR